MISYRTSALAMRKTTMLMVFSILQDGEGNHCCLYKIHCQHILMRDIILEKKTTAISYIFSAYIVNANLCMLKDCSIIGRP